MLVLWDCTLLLGMVALMMLILLAPGLPALLKLSLLLTSVLLILLPNPPHILHCSLLTQLLLLLLLLDSSDPGIH